MNCVNDDESMCTDKVIHSFKDIYSVYWKALVIHISDNSRRV